MSAVAARALRSCWQPLNRRASRAYVAGPALADAIAACRAAAGRGWAAAVGYWDGGEPPRAVADTYLRALDAIAIEGPWLDAYLSIKAPALGGARELVAEVLGRAARLGVGVHFDARGADTVDGTLALIAAAAPPVPALGVTLPARWRRSAADAERAVALGLAVRLVKGEEPDPAGGELDPRRGYLALVDRLAGRARRVAVATHDAPLARLALERLGASGTPREQELLLGLPVRRSLRAARAAGARSRLYVPYGQTRLPYRLSEAAARPAVLWWAARDLLQDGVRSLGPEGHLARRAFRVRAS